MTILSFIISSIMAAQATYPVACSFWHRLLNYLLGLVSFGFAVGFAIKLFGVMTAENSAGVMMVAAIPPMCGIWMGVWADKQRVSSKAADPASKPEVIS